MNIHEGLPERDLRDFFGHTLMKAADDDVKNSPDNYIKHEDVYYRLIKMCENDIEYNKQKIIYYKTLSSVGVLIKSYGWEEFDVSDETDKDPKYRWWMSFIGTKAEYNELLEKIKSEQ